MQDRQEKNDKDRQISTALGLWKDTYVCVWRKIETVVGVRVCMTVTETAAD